MSEGVEVADIERELTALRRLNAGVDALQNELGDDRVGADICRAYRLALNQRMLQRLRRKVRAKLAGLDTKDVLAAYYEHLYSEYYGAEEDRDE